MQSPRLLPVLLAFSLIPATLTPARERPLLGAQVWIEPGQTSAEIDGWFRQLADSHMPVARLFVMWSYIEIARDVWDYTLYDAAFRAAEKHHVKIVATLTPSGPPPFRHGDGNQGGGIVGTAEARTAAELYVAKIVERYKQSPALDTWLLVNEPGQAPFAQPLAVEGYGAWLERQYGSVAALNRSWGSAYASFSEARPAERGKGWNANSAIDWAAYWRDYQSAGLAWLATVVRRLDPAHPLHLNPHALVGNLAGVSDNLPQWRGFLDTLGCSIHPGWHFGLLPRERFALGVSYVNDLVAGSIEPKPYWVTELQGGNNIYSAMRPMDPAPADIAQWVWTSVGSGAERVIFWLLNARREGVEAAEWSMLDFHQQPSARLATAERIARVIDDHASFFDGAERVESPVTVILSLETMTLQQQYAMNDYPGRGANAHVLEALGCYAALARLGMPPRVKHFDDYDWAAPGTTPRMAILPDVRAITAAQIHKLEAFVANGNTLLITGLTGFYDPHAKAWPLAGFPLQRLTGAGWKEVHFTGDAIELPMGGNRPALPARLWLSSVSNHDARVIAERGGESLATDRRLDSGGRVLWLPTLVGQGAWFGDAAPLAGFLKDVMPSAPPFPLLSKNGDCLVRVLRNDDSFVSVVTNGAASNTTCSVQPPAGLKPTPLWGDAPRLADGAAPVHLAPHGTSVVLWAH
jgi:beta-galactosidase